MTLAAAYRIGQVPAILSDVLVSGPSQGNRHQGIPTRVDLTGPLPLEWQVTVNGLSRKSLVVCDNLAVAVAGSALGAASICRDLQRTFRNTTPNSHVLAGYFHSLDYAQSASTCCTLVGWLIEGGAAQSFRWNSSEPGNITWNGDFVIGTGAQFFRSSAWRPDQRQWDAIDNFDHAQHYALTQIASLLVNELSNGTPIQHLFGGGYDLILWDGERFRHGSSVSFLFLSIEWLRLGPKSIADLAPILIRQAEVEDCLVLRVILADNQLGLPSDNHERSAIVAPIIAKGGKHNLSRVWNWSDIPHFADRIFVVVIGTGPTGALEHWAAGVRGEQAKQFILERVPETERVRFLLPIPIMENIRIAAENQFARVN